MYISQNLLKPWMPSAYLQRSPAILLLPPTYYQGTNPIFFPYKVTILILIDLSYMLH